MKLFVLHLLHRNFISGALLISVVLMFLSASAYSKDATIDLISTTTFINVHSGPGRGHPIFHIIEKGEIITLLKSKTDWIKVATSKGIEGWIYREDIQDTVGANGETVAIGTPSREQYNNREWELGVGIGQFDSIESLGIHGGYRFTDNMTFEARLSQATGTFSKRLITTLGIMHQPFPRWRFSPYFTLATGTTSVTTNSSISRIQDDTDNLFLMGVGGYYHVTSRFMFRVEYNQYTILPSADNNFEINEWKIGLCAFF